MISDGSGVPLTDLHELPVSHPGPLGRPASIGNNLLAAGPGITTTIGAIESGEEGDVLVTYPHRRDGQEGTRSQRTALADLRGQNSLDLVRAVLAYCRESHQTVDWINFSALGATAAVVNEPERLQASVRASGLAPPDLMTPDGLQRVAAELVRKVVADGLAVPAGMPVTMSVRDQLGRTAGQGQTTMRSARRSDD